MLNAVVLNTVAPLIGLANIKKCAHQFSHFHILVILNKKLNKNIIKNIEQRH
jgi:hypothetical protein